MMGDCYFFLFLEKRGGVREKEDGAILQKEIF